MILNHFRAWAQTATPAGRAEGAGALARAYLFSNLDDEKRRDALSVLTGFLDDPSIVVRRALADAFADESRAPHHVILALADDQATIAAVVLGRSPVLSDAELIDCAATVDPVAQVAIASRPALSASVAAALAEFAAPEALVTLARNPGASIPPFSIHRMVARHGGDAPLREALLARADLPAGVRVDLVAATTAALTALINERNWMSGERMKRVATETRDKATITIAEMSRDGSGSLVAHMRETGQLTVGFAIRAILSGKTDLFEAALAELSGASLARVEGHVARCGSTGFAALYRKAGFPLELLPAFRIALRAARETDATHVRGAALSRALIERVLTACAAINTGDLDKLLVLLRRFEGEIAREQARVAPPAPLVLKEVASPLVLKAVEVMTIQDAGSPKPGRPIFIPRQAVATEPAEKKLTQRPVIARREPRHFVVDLDAIERELCAA